jgi:non-heme Fe2+,alpha-ketoglutarate-dependent halogenase
MPNSLTEAQVEQFWNDGYVTPFDCLTTDEAAECRRKLEEFEASVDGPIDEYIRIKCHLAFKWLEDIAHHPKILDAVEDLIGPDILLYLSTFWFKDAKDGKFVSWHQDSAYYGLDPHDVITLWLAFTDATPENGCMKVLPGSHKWPDQQHVETYDENNLLSRGQTIGGLNEDDAVLMPLKAGQFSMHHERQLHASGPNVTDDRRMGMSFTFMPTRVKCVLDRRSATLCAVPTNSRTGITTPNRATIWTRYAWRRSSTGSVPMPIRTCRRRRYGVNSAPPPSARP